MKIRAVEIARSLGISKATVSLALNGKPGVKEETRQKILAYVSEQEGKPGSLQKVSGRTANKVKILIINKNRKILGDQQLNLMPGCLAAMDQEIKKYGYSSEIMFYNASEDDAAQIVVDCNRDYVCGIIVFATEMDKGDEAFCDALNKPLVIYDYDDGCGKYHTVCIDNQLAVQMAVDELLREGAETIRYMAKTTVIFNFLDRRAGFSRALLENEIMFRKDDMIPLGEELSEIEQKAVEYLKAQYRPEAGYLAENYQVAVAMIRAAKRLQIEGMKLVGIDEIPLSMTDVRIPSVWIPHIDRAVIAAKLLMNALDGEYHCMMRIKSCPKLLSGKKV